MRRTGIILGLPLLAGCGALMAPGPFEVVVDSRPSGASVLHEGREVGVTPCRVPVSRASRELELRLLGFHPQRIDVGTEPGRWMVGNLVTLGLGMLGDAALGTDVDPITDPVVVYLRPLDAPAPAPWRRQRRRCPSTPNSAQWEATFGPLYLVACTLHIVAGHNGAVTR